MQREVRGQSQAEGGKRDGLSEEPERENDKRLKGLSEMEEVQLGLRDSGLVSEVLQYSLMSPIGFHATKESVCVCPFMCKCLQFQVGLYIYSIAPPCGYYIEFWWAKIRI